MKEEVRKCFILSSLWGALWSIIMIKEEEYSNNEIFYFDYIGLRIKMHEHILKLYF